jgi:hypothetical protein
VFKGLVGSSLQGKAYLRLIPGQLNTKNFPENMASSPFNPVNDNKNFKILGK